MGVAEVKGEAASDYCAGPGGRLGRCVVVWRCCPTHTGNEVSCRVGGAVEWPCAMCVHCGVDAVCCGMG